MAATIAWAIRNADPKHPDALGSSAKRVAMYLLRMSNPRRVELMEKDKQGSPYRVASWRVSASRWWTRLDAPAIRELM
jgi:hypothetical protein